MAVTAARIGSAPLLMDWTHLQKLRSTEQLFAWEAAWNKLKARFEAKEVGFYNAANDAEISQVEKSQALADKILASEKFTDCLFLGIGGSSLGPISILAALQERRMGAGAKMKFHFQENPDPLDWEATLARLKPETTLVCVVTKSGTTFETLSQFLLALQWLSKARWKSNIVAITDPEKGDLLQFAKKNEIPTLFIDPSIGGRFSAFSPVGLFPLALAGLSTKSFLQGASQVRDYMEKTATDKNAFYVIGQSLIDQFSKRPIHVCMPYATRLKSVGAWFVQLWGESLGKDGKGFTPLAALGANDQHSILQLLRDGPDDKVTCFVTVEKMGPTVTVPRDIDGLFGHEYPAFFRLQGHSLEFLLKTEYQATSRVLTKRDRPHFTFQMDSLSESSIGALFYAWSVLTAFTGTLWGVNPFDQPGVEEAKVYIREALDQEKRSGSRDQ